MKFIDEAIIEVFSGKGGDGIASFRREKFIPRGGPNGGDGGKGGNVIFLSNINVNTLLDFKFKKIFRAENGQSGKGKDCYGKSGSDLFIEVPVGTIVYDFETKEVIKDFKKNAEKYVLAEGGKGGLGNIHFKTSTNRAPRKFTKGGESCYKKLKLELNILADVGLFGLPNSGKSTFLNQTTNAKPKIADYPFTTLQPILGTVIVNISDSFVIADIPGLIKGASAGVGLGHQFLKHLQRTRLLLHFIDMSFQNNFNYESKYIENSLSLTQELEKYNATLSNKPRWVVLNKTDLIPKKYSNMALRKFQIHIKDKKRKVFVISGATGEGCQNLINKINTFLKNSKNG